ncbi:MAG: dihydropteroate synthase [Akkermansiaceae bacterium]
MIWKVNGHTIDLSENAHVMGILNTTPDSFSDGGDYNSQTTAMAHARKMIHEGATIIDIGGESTRPGSQAIEATEEISRTLPIIKALRSEWDGLISIDTKKAKVAAAALEAGADIVNDVSGLTADRDMLSLCSESDCGIVIMHMRGTPENMQDQPEYRDILGEIRGFFAERAETLKRAGIPLERACFDPGIGFGKTLKHNLTLLQNLDSLAPSGSPLLLGASRKSFLSKITGIEDPAQRDAPTFAVTTLARQQNVMLHRVHDVTGNLAALRTAERILEKN